MFEKLYEFFFTDQRRKYVVLISTFLSGQLLAIFFLGMVEVHQYFFLALGLPIALILPITFLYDKIGIKTSEQRTGVVESPTVRTVVKVNEQIFTHDLEPRLLLADYLKDNLGFSDVHIGCTTGECGACTVTLNGLAVKSCMMLAVQVHDSDVLSVAGLMKDEQAHPIIESFFDFFKQQCGFCTPGMIMAAYALLQRNPTPSEEQIRWALHGNLCRCLSFNLIVRAVQHASRKMLAAPG